MIVESMTSKEKFEEIRKDCDSVIRYLDAHMPKLIRQAKKSNNYPIKFPLIKYLSRKQNQYSIAIEFKDKKSVKKGDYLSSIFATFFYRNANAMILLTTTHLTEEPILVIYLPHLFRRYRERASIKSEISNIDLMFQFFEENPAGSYQPNPSEKYGPNAIACTISKGLLLGVKEGNVLIYKTFLKDDTLNRKQQPLYNIVELNRYMGNKYCVKRELT